MMKFDDKNTDKLLRDYFGRETETFVYEEKPKITAKNGVIAASLALVMCAGAISCGIFMPRNDFTITAYATDNSGKTTSDMQAYICNKDGEKLVIDELQALIGIEGENVREVNVKSENGEGDFIYIDGGEAVGYDSNGVKKSDEEGAQISASSTDTVKVRYHVADPEALEGYDKHIIYTPFGEASAVSAKDNDIIDITVKFEDNSEKTRRVAVTYGNDGKMTVKEIK